ncbi:MAG TPA: CAP domain-containing protein [Labilithrix sp.]|jgi:hypothetical protein|nr:CAP domain-containing protein [Labilithrix sp.]
MMSRVHLVSAVGALVFLGTACSVSSGNLQEEEESSGASTATTKGDTHTSPEPVEAGVDYSMCANAPGPTRRDQVCHRWRCEGRDAAAAAKWTGDSASCNAGELDADASARALRLVNLHRYLADVPAVTSEASWVDAAQQCALVAHANTKLSHTPTSDWRCWSDMAALTSSISLIANRSAPPAINAFIEDPGNATTMVHRRWLLSEELSYVGFGSTDRYSCIVVDGRSLDIAAGNTKANRKRSSDEMAKARGWVAWPPAGPVPMDVFASEKLDEVGWTVQSSSDELDHATVSVSVGGQSLPVRVAHLLPLQGSRSAIAFFPNGWKTEAGRDYKVSISGGKPIEFTVQPTDCK